jgi:iron complex transport system ATP-binding protein
MTSAERSCLVARDVSLGERIHAKEFSLSEGECVVLCGPNGSGKSSLLRLLAGLERADAGKVSIGEVDLSRMSRIAIASKIAWLPQRPQLIEAISCEAVVAAARYRFSESPQVALERAMDVLSSQGIGHLIGRLAQQISGGELQRVLVAALVAQDVPFLLVDEPANHLDPAHQLSTYRKLGELWQAGKGVIIVSHDVRLAQLLGPADKVRIVCVNRGRIVHETRLDASDLSTTLGKLYGVDFVPQDQSQGLTVRLSAAGQRPA